MSEAAQGHWEVDLDVDGFSTSCRRDGNRSVVEVAGELDLSTVEPLKTTLREAVAEGVQVVEIDASRVTFIDSVALAMLLAFHVNAPKEGVVMRLAATSPEFDRVVQLAGLEADLLGDGAPPTTEVADAPDAPEADATATDADADGGPSGEPTAPI